MRGLAFSCVLPICLSMHSSVYAAPSEADKELAKKLYTQAAADMEREAYDRACPQFEAALRLNPDHVRTAMTLGMCEDHWGKWVRALSRFEYARSVAVAQNASDKLVEIDRQMASLRSRIPLLRIVVPSDLANSAGLVVIRNGQAVSPDDFGKPLAVDPGAYEISASAPNRGAWTQKVRLEPGQTVAVTLGSSDKPIARPNDPGRDQLTNEEPASTRPLRSTLGILGIGLGGAGLVAGSIFGGLAISKNNASDDGHCDAQNYCDSIGTSLRHEGQSYGNTSTALFVVGGVLATAGIVLVVTAPKEKPLPRAAQTRVFVGLGQVSVQGTF